MEKRHSDEAKPDRLATLQQKTDRWSEEHKEAIESHNRFIEEHGIWSEKYRSW